MRFSVLNEKIDTRNMAHSESHIMEMVSARKYSEAFDGIVAVYGERMYWQIRRYVLSHEDADDVLQECWMKIWKKLPQFRGQSGIFTWIYRIVVNTSLNFLKKRRLMSVFRSGEDLEVVAKGVFAEESFNGDNVQAALYKAIAKLPPKQRLVFEMRYFDEMDYRTMSGILGTSEGALKASYHFSSTKIKEEMKKLNLTA